MSLQRLDEARFPQGNLAAIEFSLDLNLTVGSRERTISTPGTLLFGPWSQQVLRTLGRGCPDLGCRRYVPDLAVPFVWVGGKILQPHGRITHHSEHFHPVGGDVD